MGEFAAAQEEATSWEALPSVDSTNAYLARQHAPDGAVVITDWQTAGRGRLDRTWVAPAGSALAISVTLRPQEQGRDLSADEASWIPLLAGWAMVRALDAALDPVGLRADVKWPNDVLVAGSKLCGVLVERADDGAFIVGAGLNTRMSAAELPVPTATSLAVLGVDTSDDALDAIVAAYLRNLRASVRALAEAGGDAVEAGLASALSARCATIGAEVRVDLPDGATLTGRATGLDARGRLVVDQATRSGGSEASVAVSAGDVVHVRAHRPSDSE